MGVALERQKNKKKQNADGQSENEKARHHIKQALRKVYLKFYIEISIITENPEIHEASLLNPTICVYLCSSVVSLQGF